MVNLWPWKGDETSPASFEKTLSALSSKITKATSRLENCRQQGRRVKGLWTLYSSFGYLLYIVVAALFVGWKNWGAVEYIAITGSPLVIYTIRLGLATIYEYRISTLQANLNSLQKQRDTTIDKLKAATKYNTTQQLLEKYGSTSSRSKSGSQPQRKTSPVEKAGSAMTTGRTGFTPPATANIPGRNLPVSLPSTPQRSSPISNDLGRTPPFTAAAMTPPWQQASPMETTAEFAPSAFSAAPQYIQAEDGSKWYDRFMDLLLGEDETSPKNRIVLLCKSCRLVNGQAPPGVKQLEDIGKWRCSGCGTMNGEETETKKLVAEIKKQVAADDGPASAKLETRPVSASDEEAVLVGGNEDGESDVTQYSDNELEDLQDEDANPNIEEEVKPEKPKRGRPKGSGKKRY